MRRSPVKLIRTAIPLPGLPEINGAKLTKEAESGDFKSLTLYLSGTAESGESVRAKVTFQADQWHWKLTLNLTVTDSKETGQALCTELWEKAQLVEYNS